MPPDFVSLRGHRSSFATAIAPCEAFPRFGLAERTERSPSSQNAQKLRIFVCHASDLFTDSQPHGDGLIAHSLVTRLADRGHMIHVAVMEASLKKPLPRRVVLHAIALHSRNELMRRVEFAFASRRLFQKLSSIGGFDLIHQLNPVSTGISLAFMGCGLPVVLGNYVPHWPEFDASSNLLLRFVGRIQQRAADALLISTPAALSRLLSVDPTDSRVVEIPYGVAADEFYPIKNLAPSCPTALFLGVLEQRKGIHTLLDAFPRVLARVPNALLVIAGDGSEKQHVIARAAAPELAGHVHVLGKVSRENLPRLINGSDLLCAPSFGEPYGMAALEAMACGKPVVGTNAGGLSHLIDDRGGRRVRPGDSAALADALSELLGSPEKRLEMGRHNRQIVEQRYAWDHVLDRLESVYRAVLDGSGVVAAPVGEGRSLNEVLDG